MSSIQLGGATFGPLFFAEGDAWPSLQSIFTPGIAEFYRSDGVPDTGQALDRIAAIYEIEATARGVMPNERVRQRQQTASLVDGFFDWATAVLAKLSAKSPLADAF